MADRNTERKGRKVAASKPKAEARVASFAGGGATTHNVSISESVDATVSVEATVIRAAPALRPGWEASRDEVLSRAAEVADLYQRLGDIIAAAQPAPGTPGHNQGPALDEGLVELRDYQATAELTAELLQERTRPSDPDTKVIKHSGNVFKALAHGAKAFGMTVGRWIVEGLVKGEAAQFAPGLIEQLVGALHKIVGMIASWFQ